VLSSSKGQFAYFEATSEHDNSQTNEWAQQCKPHESYWNSWPSAKRGAACNAPYLCSLAWVYRRYMPSRACWGSCTNKFIYRGRRMSYTHWESALRNAKLISEVEKLLLDTNAREKTALRNLICDCFGGQEIIPLNIHMLIFQWVEYFKP